MTHQSTSKKRKQSRRRTTRPKRNFVPLALVSAVLALIVLGLVLSSRQPAARQTEVPVSVSGKPSLQVDQERIDFGDVPVNRMVKASFALSNTGDQPLVLSHSPVAEVVEGC